MFSRFPLSSAWHAHCSVKIRSERKAEVAMMEMIALGLSGGPARWLRAIENRVEVRQGSNGSQQGDRR
jgi:hypothetical protein